MNELRWILKSLGDDLTEEDIDDMIADVDTDGSGWVDYDGMLSTNNHSSKSVVRASMLGDNSQNDYERIFIAMLKFSILFY